MALKWLFGQIWSFLAFFGMLWVISPKISVAQSILRVEFEFKQFQILKKEIVTIEVKMSPGADMLGATLFTGF
jgi:hypothetical protein